MGIDVSKDTLDVAMHGAQQHWSFTNDSPGIAKTVDLLESYLQN